MNTNNLTPEMTKLITGLYEDYFDAHNQSLASSDDHNFEYYRGKANGIYNAIADLVTLLNIDRVEVSAIKARVIKANEKKVA